MKVPNMHVESLAFDCPVCGEAVAARVEVKVDLTAHERVGNMVPVKATTTMERFHVRHDCGGPIKTAEPTPTPDGPAS